MARTQPAVTLEDRHIVATIVRLQRRVTDRFPGSGLSTLCGTLADVARDACRRRREFDRPILWIRLLGGLLVGLLVIVIALAAWQIVLGTADAEPDEGMSAAEWLQTVEAGTNEAILIGAGILFLFTVERRIKRTRALSAIHELRSMCHIIDMHQLTKDPERTLAQFSGTENSPKQTLSPLQLNRYLDYCSEMLSLTGKVAALYIETFDDPALIAAVGEVEELSTGLSRKIWQKIMILNQLERRLGEGAFRTGTESAQ